MSTGQSDKTDGQKNRQCNEALPLTTYHLPQCSTRDAIACSVRRLNFTPTPLLSLLLVASFLLESLTTLRSNQLCVSISHNSLLPASHSQYHTARIHLLMPPGKRKTHTVLGSNVCRFCRAPQPMYMSTNNAPVPPVPVCGAECERGYLHSQDCYIASPADTQVQVEDEDMFDEDEPEPEEFPNPASIVNQSAEDKRAVLSLSLQKCWNMQQSLILSISIDDVKVRLADASFYFLLLWSLFYSFVSSTRSSSKTSICWAV